MGKAKIKADYIANLQRIYAGRVDYQEGSRPFDLANQAADKALAGRMKLEGEAWFAALAANGIQKGATMKMLSELPE